MQNGNEATQEQAGNDQFDKSLDWSLKVHGFVFPESDDEVEEFCQKTQGKITPLPPELQDPMAVFLPRQTPVVRQFEPRLSQEVYENLAMVAREGKEIPTDLLQRMEEDRKRSKKPGQS